MTAIPSRDRATPPGAGPQVVHVSPRVLSGGGIETVLRWHRTTDAGEGLDAWQLALFDRRPGTPPARYATLRSGWRDSLRTLRRKFAAALAAHPAAVVVYHNGWGLPLFSDTDGSTRRLVYLHAAPSYLGPQLPAWDGWLDGVVSVNAATLAEVGRRWPQLDAARQAFLRAPVQPPAGLAQPGGGSVPVIGYAGRLERTHKRVDRLPELLRAMAALGLPFRFEVLGDGPLRRTLARELGERVRFHGWLDGEAYWRVLSRWDAMVFFSDTEGAPLAMFEGMAAGVLPFFPAIGESLADDYAPRIDPRCHYPAGNMPALAGAMAGVLRAPAAALADARGRARTLAAGHRAEIFGRDFSSMVRQVATAARISRPPDAGRRARWTDWLPLGLVARVCPGALQR